MPIVNFFDPGNLDHIKALQFLYDYGVWPKGFLSDDIKNWYGNYWSLRLRDKIIKHWMEEKLKGT